MAASSFGKNFILFQNFIIISHCYHITAPAQGNMMLQKSHISFLRLF
jgi:hypothetical protein